MGSDRRDVGRVRHEPALRREPRPPDRARAALLRASTSGGAAPRCGSPTCSDTRPACRRCSRPAGCSRFVTQKLSWNKQNRFPHHTFWWEGLDGTRVLTHFPPVDTYNAEITPAECAHAVANFSEHGWSDWSLMPFGHGDGGGGPTREMLERARRLADVDGAPRRRDRYAGRVLPQRRARDPSRRAGAGVARRAVLRDAPGNPDQPDPHQARQPPV